MSISNPTPQDAEAARIYGLASFSGDLEQAEEIGIPVSAEDAERHFQAGQELGTVLHNSGVLPTPADIARQAAYDRDQIEFRQTGPIPYSSEADKIQRTAHIEELKAQVPRSKDQ